jgi:hypothetical protein
MIRTILTVIGFVYWIVCSITLFRSGTPKGVNGDGTKIRRDWADWFMVITAPFWITLFALIYWYQRLTGQIK